MTRVICCIALCITCLLTGCGTRTENALLPYPPVVVWDNKAYVVSNNIVSEEELSDKIGEVKRFIDPNKKFPEKNEDSTIAPVGSGLFSIIDLDVKDALAVEISGQYVKAEYYEP